MSRYTKALARAMALGPKDHVAYGPPLPVPLMRIHHAFEQWSEVQPDAVAVRHGNHSLTYAELNERAEHLADVMWHSGIRPGDHVGIFMRRSISLVESILAVLKIGATYIPKDVKISPTAELADVSEQAGIKTVLTTKEYHYLVPQLDETRTLVVDDLGARADKVPTRSKQVTGLSGDEIAFVLFTSGTTGKPNGVRVSHKNLCNILLQAPGNLGMAPGKRVSQLLNIAFDMAAWEILGCLSNGATLMIRHGSIQNIVEQSDIVIATPSILADIDTGTCRHVEAVAVAGEPCPKSLAEEWSRFATFYNSCGPTEITIINTIAPYVPLAGKISIGQPLPNTTVYLLDDNLNGVSRGEIGEMWVGGDGVTMGYLNNPRLTDERYKPDPYLGDGYFMFRTRDLAKFRSDGHLEHYGRTDDQVKIRGFRVELDAINSLLESLPGIHQAVTIKLDSCSLSSFVTPVTANIEAAKAALQELLPYYSVPETIIPLGVLPITDRGKVDKRKLTHLAVKAQGLNQVNIGRGE